MNVEKQIYAYKALKENNQAFFVDTHEDADRIIKSLEKTVKKKVMNVRKSKCIEDVEYNGPDALYGECPCCRELNNNLFNASYCGDCGQRLDWGE